MHGGDSTRLLGGTRDRNSSQGPENTAKNMNKICSPSNPTEVERICREDWQNIPKSSSVI